MHISMPSVYSLRNTFIWLIQHTLESSHMPGLTWDHTEDIALSLYEAHPEIDPTHIRYTDLHKWITELPDFRDDPAKSTEGKLEAIQMAWLEEYQDNK
jgi:FeS assembly protein IscX